MRRNERLREGDGQGKQGADEAQESSKARFRSDRHDRFLDSPKFSDAP